MKHKRIDIPAKPEWWNSSIPPEQIVTLGWNNQGETWWNDACADVLEVFGLPGQRFYYKPYPDRMTFTFKSIKDAKLCNILLSEKLASREKNLNTNGNPLP
jgi:hypothetical protein